MNLTTRDIRKIRQLRYGDGLSYQETAAVIGCNKATVGKYAPGQPGKVPNDKLREAFCRSSLSAGEVASRMGWMCRGSYINARGERLLKKSKVGDGSRVKRTLGLLPDSNGKEYRSVRSMIDAETAGLMAEALGLMAWEVMPDEDEVAA